jgi:hypothetical protein
MKRLKKHWDLVTIIIIVLLGIDICLHIDLVTITDQNIILTFIGILATFVVVSNYWQVKSIQDEFDELLHA